MKKTINKTLWKRKKKKHTAVFGHKMLVEVSGYVCLEFILSKGRKKTGAGKTDGLHLNY